MGALKSYKPLLYCSIINIISFMGPFNYFMLRRPQFILQSASQTLRERNFNVADRQFL